MPAKIDKMLSDKTQEITERCRAIENEVCALPLHRIVPWIRTCQSCGIRVCKCDLHEESQHCAVSKRNFTCERSRANNHLRTVMWKKRSCANNHLRAIMWKRSRANNYVQDFPCRPLCVLPATHICYVAGVSTRLHPLPWSYSSQLQPQATTCCRTQQSRRLTWEMCASDACVAAQNDCKTRSASNATYMARHAKASWFLLQIQTFLCCLQHLCMLL
jgi:hypothetical protein